MGRMGCPETLLLTSSELTDIQKFTSYLLENQLRLHYKSQSINVVCGKKIHVIRDSRDSHMKDIRLQTPNNVEVGGTYSYHCAYKI